MKLKVITHYLKDDKDCDGDYSFIAILDGKNVIAEFGDDYHDRGGEKADGFIKGIEWATKKKVK